MWVDPLDQLIADLEEIAPPEQGKYGGGQEAFNEMQHWQHCILRRIIAAEPDGEIDQDDPEVQREREGFHRVLNRFLGRPDDWTPGS